MSTRSRLDAIEKAAGPDPASVPMAPPRLFLPGDPPDRMVPAGPPGSRRMTISKSDRRRRNLSGEHEITP